LDVKLEVLTGELYETNTKIDRIKNDITKYAKEIDETYERLLSLERYSTDYNLRFYNIPESTGEDCIAKLRVMLDNDPQFHPNIKNAHRIGPFKDDGSARPILAKFLYRPERFKVIKKKREHQQRKRKLRLVMKDAFEAGKDLDFIVASIISTARFIKLRCLNSIYFCICVSPILNVYLAYNLHEFLMVKKFYANDARVL